MSIYYGELEHNFSKRDRVGFKENKVHARVNHQKSEVKAGEELIIKMPRLTSDHIIYPDSLELAYNFKLNDGETEIPDHLTSAIVERFGIKIDGKSVVELDSFCHLAVYRELWHPKHKYDTELTKRGIQSEATKKKRHNLDGAAADTLALIHKERYAFNLGSFLTDASFCPQAIHNDIVFTLKLTTGEYKLENICLEYDYVINPPIAQSIKAKYLNHTHLIDSWNANTAVAISAAESEFEVNILTKRKSLQGVLLLFKTDNNVSTTYINPNIKSVKIDIDSVSNQLFSNDYLLPYAYEDARAYFKTTNGEMNINQASFYDDKYCMFFDLRTITDKRCSNVGRNIEDHIKMRFSKNASTAGKVFVYFVCDKVVEFENNQIKDTRQ